MASYLILDGYNVVGALDRYRDADSFDAARELLVNDALKAAGWTGRRIIVVFDAHRSPESEKLERRAGGAVLVVYSAPGESADDVIER
ncbi:MAG: NYN domain-containing protein, partial [Rubrobacteraceae bacterium]